MIHRKAAAWDEANPWSEQGDDVPLFRPCGRCGMNVEIGFIHPECALLELDELKAYAATREKRDFSRTRVKRTREERLERKRQLAAEQRKLAGIAPRDQYLKAVKRQRDPWEVLGISRTTWYKRRENAPSPPG